MTTPGSVLTRLAAVRSARPSSRCAHDRDQVGLIGRGHREEDSHWANPCPSAAVDLSRRRCHRYRFPGARVDRRPGLDAVPIPTTVRRHSPGMHRASHGWVYVKLSSLQTTHRAVRHADRPSCKCMDRAATPHDGDGLGEATPCATATKHGAASPKRRSSPGISATPIAALRPRGLGGGRNARRRTEDLAHSAGPALATRAARPPLRRRAPWHRGLHPRVHL